MATIIQQNATEYIIFIVVVYRAIEQDIEVIRPTICTRVFCSKIFTTLKLLHTLKY
jgi:hypothetical protein